MKQRHPGRLVALLTATCLALTACGSSDAGNEAETTAPDASDAPAAEATSAPPEPSPVAEEMEPLSASIGLGARGITAFLPVELAEALGYFDDEALDIEIEYLQGGPASLAALQAGEVDFGATGVGEALNSTLAGKPLVMVASFLYNPGMVVGVDAELADEITSVEDLAGRAVGITSFESGSHLLMSAVLAGAGLTEDDVELVAVGVDTAAAALDAGQVVAATLYDPFATVLLEDGRVEWLVDLAQDEDVATYLGGAYQFSGLLALSSIIDSDPEVVQRVVNGLYRACRFIAESTPGEIADALPEDIVTDRDAYVAGLEHIQPAFAGECMPSLEGVENELAAEVAAGFREQGEVDSVAPEDLIDVTFVEESMRRFENA